MDFTKFKQQHEAILRDYHFNNSMVFRILDEFGLLEINSWTYLILVPVVIGYLPFLLDKKIFTDGVV